MAEGTSIPFLLNQDIILNNRILMSAYELYMKTFPPRAILGCHKLKKLLPKNLFET